MKTLHVEEQTQTMEYDPLQINAVTSIVPFPPKKKVACETKKNSLKVEKLEWKSIMVNYTMLHKHYLKLSKIKLTCM